MQWEQENIDDKNKSVIAKNFLSCKDIHKPKEMSSGSEQCHDKEYIYIYIIDVSLEL